MKTIRIKPKTAVETLLPKFKVFATFICQDDEHLQEDIAQEMALAILKHARRATLPFFTSRAIWAAKTLMRTERRQEIRVKDWSRAMQAVEPCTSEE